MHFTREPPPPSPGYHTGRLAKLYLVKISNDLIQQAKALQSFFVDITLSVEHFEVRNGCKHDTDTVIRLMVPVLQRDRRETRSGDH